jgi:hypothetical protein
MKDSNKNSSPIAPASTTPVDGVGTKATNASGETTGILVKKTGNAKGGTDWTKQAAPARTKVKATGGAAYAITAKIPAYKSSEAGATQANGRLFQAAVNRTAPNFQDGVNSQS